MATLTNTQISVTYVGLLKTSANTVLTSTAQQITDGDGNNSIMFLSTAGVGIGGAAASGKELDVTGNVLITGDLIIDNIKIDGNTISAESGVVTLADGAIATTQSASDNSTKIATTAYVDNQVTIQDLDFAGDSNTGSVDLDSQTFTIAGTSNEIETSASGQTLTVGLPSTVAITTKITSPIFGLSDGTANKIQFIGGQGNWRINISDSANQFVIHSESLVADYFTVIGGGGIKLNVYGSGSKTGTVAKNLAVDSSGNIIETDGNIVDGSGTANDVVMWSDSNTLTDAPIAISGNNATFAGSVGVAGSSIVEKFNTPNIKVSGSTITGTVSANTLFIDNLSSTSRFFSCGADSSTNGTFNFNTGTSAALGATMLTLASTGATFAGDITATSKKFISTSSSSGDYVRLYAGSGTAQWDIYGSGENLRLSENSSGGGILQVDSGASFGSDVAIGGTANTYSNQTVLTINGSTYGRLDLESSNTLRSSLFSGSSNTTLAVASGFFTIDVGGSEAIRIDTSGNFGLGTASPRNTTNHKSLTINGSSVGRLDLATSDTIRASFYAVSSQVGLQTEADIPLIFGTGTSSTTALTLDSSQNAFFAGDINLSGTAIYKNSGTLEIKSQIINIKGVTTNENIAGFNENGSVDLYHDNSKKFETTSSGVSVTGSVTADGVPAFIVGTIGAIGNTANDLNIYSTTSGHNGLRMHINGILPTDNSGTIIDNDADLGDPSYRFKDLYLGGNITAGSTINLINGSNTRSISCDGSGNLDISNAANNATIFHLQDSALTLGTSIGTGTLSLFAGAATFAGSVTITQNSGSLEFSNTGSGHGSITTGSSKDLNIGSGSGNVFINNNTTLNGSLSITADGSNAVTFTESGNGLMTIAVPDDFVVDCGSDIILDAAGIDIRLRSNGTEIGNLNMDSSNLNIISSVQDRDILFKGNDGGSTITALTLDMSNGGSATFADDIDMGGSLNMTGSSKVLRLNSGGFIDFDGTNLQLNTQRNPNTGAFNDTNKSHAHIGLQGPDGGSQINFGTAAANNTVATTRMVITKDGNLGIANTSPNAPLSFANSVATRKISLFEVADNNFQFYGFGVESNTLVYSTGDNGDDHVFFSGQSSSTRRELARFSGNGDILFGTSTKANDFTYLELATNNRRILNIGSSTVSQQTLVNFRNPNGVVGGVSTDGSSTSFSGSSDYRLKENVTPMTGSLDRISELKPSRFNFIGEEKTLDGFLAHEVSDIVPQAIIGTKDEVDEDGNPVYQQIDQSKLVPLLVGAIQELKEEIEILKNK